MLRDGWHNINKLYKTKNELLAGKTLLTHAIARETGSNFFNISAKNLDPGPAGSGRIKYPDKKGPNSATNSQKSSI